MPGFSVSRIFEKGEADGTIDALHVIEASISETQSPLTLRINLAVDRLFLRRRLKMLMER
jgi:hypothetical protein